MSDGSIEVLPKAERLAQNSFNLGIASLICGITSLPAIIYSVRALVRIKKEGSSKTAYRKAIFSLVFSSCVFGLCVFLVVSAFVAAQDMADEANCTNRIKHLALEIRNYSDDHGLPAGRWCDAIQSTNNLIFQCPSTPRKQTCGYAMNQHLKELKGLYNVMEDTVLLFESDAGWNALGGPEIAVARHRSQLLVALVDGSVLSVKVEDLQKLRWDPGPNAPVSKR